LAALKPKAKQYDVYDDVRGLGVRVGKTSKAFIFRSRLPGGKGATRRVIGEYGVMSLAEARDKAREWQRLLSEGKDPSVEEDRRKASELRKLENSFASVAEAYFEHMKRQKLRRAHEVERDIRREFVSRWGKRPVTDIGRADVMAVIDAAIKRDSPWQAHHIHSYASRLFNWAIERGTYGLETSPCERMRPTKIIGPKHPRTRVLSDDELRTVWQVAQRLNYPIGPFVHMLILTGQRKSEVAGARWSEIDLKRKLWTIPHARMKAGAVHAVPLTDDAIFVLATLPRFKHGDCLFSTTFGATPINGFSKGKRRIDAAMDANVAPWVLHDIRRTMRTHLSALPIPDLVRELVIGHTKPGLHKVYDQHAYLDEKRHALELWQARLRDIVKPAPANVVKLKGR